MFSPAERRYLALVVTGPRDGTARRLEAAFPNPVYRRKLLWGIRHKAGASLDDWALYAAAAERDGRVVPGEGGVAHSDVPVAREPFVVAIDGIRRWIGHRRRAGRTSPPSRGSP